MGDAVPDGSNHSGVSVSPVSTFCPMVGALEPPEGVNSVQQSELAVERSQQLSVPRSIMSGHRRMESAAPNRGTSWSHLERRQLVDTTLLGRVLQAAPRHQVRDLIVL